MLLILAALFCGCGSEAPKLAVSEEVKEETAETLTVEEQGTETVSAEKPAVEEPAKDEPAAEELVEEEAVVIEPAEETIEENKDNRNKIIETEGWYRNALVGF